MPNLLLEGNRGGGKSYALRWDCHLKALAVPGFKYIILRRTFPELRKSHLIHIGGEMQKLGGTFLKTTTEARYPNGSIGLFGHAENDEDADKYISAEFDQVVFDEITSFPFEYVTKISASARVPAGSGRIAMIRGATNPLGVSAEEVYSYFIARDVDPAVDPDYDKREWGSINITMKDNPSLDIEQYAKKFSGMPEAYRKAWLHGEWGIEGVYFSVEDRHLLQNLPLVESSAYNGGPLIRQQLLDAKWVNIYRILDWGWHDPTVCLWVAVLPNGREIPFKEKMWLRTPAQTVAADIYRESEGMKVVTTIADPTLWDGYKEMGHCMADVFEEAHIPMTRARNDRVACGRAIQEHLNATLEDGGTKSQIYEPGCPTLVRALRAMRVDKKHPGRIADSKLDHLPICFGYFCMAGVGASQVPNINVVPRWMQKSTRRVLGSEGVRSKGY